MAAALAFSGTAGCGRTVTANLTGASNNTVYNVSLAHPGGNTQNVSVTTNGSGAATFTFVPPVAGSLTATVTPTVPTTTCTATLNIGGHGT